MPQVRAEQAAYAATVDGTGLRRLTDGKQDNNTFNAWSDDGRTIYIDSNRRDPASRDSFAGGCTPVSCECAAAITRSARSCRIRFSSRPIARSTLTVPVTFGLLQGQPVPLFPGLPPDEVVLAPPGAVRKTSSGKIRRSATREAYVRGGLSRGRRAVLVQYVRLAGAHLRAHGVEFEFVPGVSSKRVWT